MNEFSREEIERNFDANCIKVCECLESGDFEKAKVHLNAAAVLNDMLYRVDRDGVRFTSVDINWGEGNTPSYVTVLKREES